MEILVDPLSVVMMLIVSGVGGLIVWYSMGYMAGDDEERRYFAYMSLFVFSMLMLVQAGNFLLLLVGWGLVGLASYLLIGFWHQRAEAVAAAKKAFVMNAIGDATFALAIVLLIWNTGTLELLGVFEEVDGLSDDHGEPRRPRAARRRGREVGPDPAPHLAPGRDGGPDAGLGPDPRGDDGDGRRLPARAGAPDLRGGARRPEPRGDPRHGDAPRRGPRRARAVGHQAGHRVLDDVPDRLHVPRRGDRGVRLRDLPPDDARLLQGAALPRRGSRHPPPRRRAGHPPDGRPEDRPPADAHRLPDRHGRARRDCRRSPGSGRRMRSSPRRSPKEEALGWTLFVAGLAGALLTGAYAFRLYFTVFQGAPQEAAPSRRTRARQRTGRARSRCSSRSASSPCSRRSAACSRSRASGIRSRTGSRRRASRWSRRRPGRTT